MRRRVEVKRSALVVLSWCILSLLARTSVLSAADAAALTSALDHLSFGAGVTSNGGGTQNISWTWDPTAANLDFLKSTDVLTIAYDVTVGDSTSKTMPR